MDYKPRFIIKSSIDKECNECEFKVEDSWASRYGAIVTFKLSYPYDEEQLDKKLKECKNVLRKDFDNMQREGIKTHRFFTFSALISAIILAIVIIQAIKGG